MSHLLASPELLSRHGVALAETDRGGDITYHGPGQLVAYPILDLNLLGLGLHAYMRLLEDAVIETCGTFGIQAQREPGATGVWVPGADGGSAKVCAMGVRVRKWVSMHGLALNVTTNLEHFGLIVPCGLPGRPVTTVERELGASGRPCPGMVEVKRVLACALGERITQAEANARTARQAAKAS
jgi:lipoyl(octanoyl) transferase